MLRGNGGDPVTYPLRVPAWDGIPHLVHGFLGRAHGLPPGPFDLADIRSSLVDAGEDPKRVVAARQVHGAAVVGPELAGDGREMPIADALVSASADVVLTIRTADCVPILLVAPRARAVAAVHAGWRGAVSGVVDAAVKALTDRYDARPHELLAAIGPAIGPCCYEFGAEHLGAFRDAFGPAVESAWSASADAHGTSRPRVRLDLRLVSRLALATAGVPDGAITVVGPCTADTPRDLHSYRRDGANAGRQLSYVGWRS